VTIGARADVPEESAGLDLSQHGEEAYFGSDLGSAAGTGGSLGGSVVVETYTLEPTAVGSAGRMMRARLIASIVSEPVPRRLAE